MVQRHYRQTDSPYQVATNIPSCLCVIWMVVLFWVHVWDSWVQIWDVSMELKLQQFLVNVVAELLHLFPGVPEKASLNHLPIIMVV